mmetsp:Transcript_20232/g.36694  ORF Transcript_20232/g.36694 Transcript_20232/m.36694 type:complete len:308 (+) Transcript_20232:98-1021(+)
MKENEEQGKATDSRLFWAIRDQPRPKNGQGNAILYPFAAPELSLDEKGPTTSSYQHVPVAMRQELAGPNKRRVTVFSDCADQERIQACSRTSPLPSCFTCDGGFDREGSASVPESCSVEQLSAVNGERYDLAAMMGVTNSGSSSDIPSFMPMTTAEQRWMWREFLHETVARTQVTDLYNHFDVEADPPNYKRPPPSCRTLFSSFPEVGGHAESRLCAEFLKQEEPVSVPLLVGDPDDEVLDAGEPPAPFILGPTLPDVPEEDEEALHEASAASPQSCRAAMPIATYADAPPYSVPEIESFQEGLVRS